MFVPVKPDHNVLDVALSGCGSTSTVKTQFLLVLHDNSLKKIWFRNLQILVCVSIGHDLSRGLDGTRCFTWMEIPSFTNMFSLLMVIDHQVGACVWVCLGPRVSQGGLKHLVTVIGPRARTLIVPHNNFQNNWFRQCQKWREAWAQIRLKLAPEARHVTEFVCGTLFCERLAARIGKGFSCSARK